MCQPITTQEIRSRRNNYLCIALDDELTNEIEGDLSLSMVIATQVCPSYYIDLIRRLIISRMAKTR